MEDKFNLVLCPHCSKEDGFIVTELELDNSNVKNPINGSKFYYSKLYIIKCVYCNKFISTIPTDKSEFTIKNGTSY